MRVTRGVSTRSVRPEEGSGGERGRKKTTRIVETVCVRRVRPRREGGRKKTVYSDKSKMMLNLKEWARRLEEGEEREGREAL